MGRGKTSAAMGYMSSHCSDKRFLFITPYLKEVDRICSLCDFEQPNGDSHSKLSDLKRMLIRGENVASSHSLFYLLDDAALGIIRDKKYSLIVDESIDTIHREDITKKDFDLIVNTLASVEDGKLVWLDDEYSGKFNDYKEMAKSGLLFVRDSAILKVMKPDVLLAFDEVIMMTYLFGGQYQKAYLDYFGFQYKLCGIRIDYVEGNPVYSFTDEPDVPPNVDYNDLISIIDDDRLNYIGSSNTALSKHWFISRSRNHKDIVKLRRNLDTFLRRRCKCKVSDVMWTCFKDVHDWMIGSEGRYSTSFITLTSRATNEYKNKSVVAYLANRFADPNIIKFFYEKGIEINEEEFALSEMLQFIWRSAIRDYKHIDLYIPSKRMRNLLIDWIIKRNNGGLDG